MSGAECKICSNGKELLEEFQKAEDGRYDFDGYSDAGYEWI